MIQLFHLRRDVWDEQFYVDTGTMEIVGTTPKGRAIVTRLEMNSKR